MARCTGLTSGGKRCRNKALPDTDPPVCHVDHGNIGRPPDPPPQRLIDDLAEKLEQGNYIKVACAAVDLSLSTYHDWLAKGKAQPDGPFGPFAARVERSLALAQADLVAAVEEAAAKDWKAAAWLLERRWPEQYARPETRKVADPHRDRPPAPPEAGQEPGTAASAFDELDAVTDLGAERAKRQGA